MTSIMFEVKPFIDNFHGNNSHNQTELDEIKSDLLYNCSALYLALVILVGVVLNIKAVVLLYNSTRVSTVMFIHLTI